MAVLAGASDQSVKSTQQADDTNRSNYGRNIAVAFVDSGTWVILKTCCSPVVRTEKASVNRQIQTDDREP